MFIDILELFALGYPSGWRGRSAKPLAKALVGSNPTPSSLYRNIAQSGRAPLWWSDCHGFESHYSYKQLLVVPIIENVVILTNNWKIRIKKVILGAGLIGGYVETSAFCGFESQLSDFYFAGYCRIVEDITDNQ